MTQRRGPLLPWGEYRAALRWLAETREGAGLTQAQVAERLGFSESWVSLRETGSQRMTQAEVRLIAVALEVEIPVLSADVPALMADGGAR